MIKAVLYGLSIMFFLIAIAQFAVMLDTGVNFGWRVVAGFLSVMLALIGTVLVSLTSTIK